MKVVMKLRAPSMQGAMPCGTFLQQTNSKQSRIDRDAISG
jgi:hypothetical protein